MELSESNLKLIKKEVKKALKSKYDPMPVFKKILESEGKDEICIRLDSVTGNDGPAYATVMLVYGDK